MVGVVRITYRQRPKSISKVDKFGYLLMCVEGSAAATNKGLPRTNNNYDLAIQILKDTYDNKQLIRVQHMRALKNCKWLKRSMILKDYERYMRTLWFIFML